MEAKKRKKMKTKQKKQVKPNGFEVKRKQEAKTRRKGFENGVVNVIWVTTKLVQPLPPLNGKAKHCSKLDLSEKSKEKRRRRMKR